MNDIDYLGDIEINGPSPSGNLNQLSANTGSETDLALGVQSFLDSIENGFNSASVITQQVATIEQQATVLRNTINPAPTPIAPAAQPGGWPFSPVVTIVGGVVIVLAVVAYARSR